MSRHQSWGRYPKVDQQALVLTNRHNALPTGEHSLLPFGNGRSYGDSCLNSEGVVLDAIYFKKLISFDLNLGVLRCESGVTFAEIIDVLMPKGWFLPVTPGTKFVSVGGAIANDVHGKNHHRDGNFGHFVRQFELVRSSGERLICSPSQNKELFHATIGGLGLTGMITWAEIQMKPIQSAFLDVETICYSGLDEFKRLSDDSKKDFEYTVAWVDCMATGADLGRGIFMRANHSTNEEASFSPKKSLTIPLDFPAWALNRYSISYFNKLYYWKGSRSHGKTFTQSYDAFFYPLDGIHHWNRIYGRQGFLQYQFVVPSEDYGAIKEAFEVIAKAGAGSFLAVLKEFGDIPSLGMLSFPRQGVCLALDFPNQGSRTFTLLDRLDAIVREAGGAVYPAKDARMSAESFAQFFPKQKEFETYVDSAFSSDFWRRTRMDQN